MRNLIRGILIVVAAIFLLSGILGLLDIDSEFLDSIKEFFPFLFGS